VGHKQDGRARYSKQAKRTLVEACLKPGVSVSSMALVNGLNTNLLRKWITQYQDLVDTPITEVTTTQAAAVMLAASADVPGSGLGLSLVRAVLGMHGFGLKITNTQPGTQVVIQCWRGTHRLAAKST